MDARHLPPEMRGITGVMPVARPISDEEKQAQADKEQAALDYQKELNNRQLAANRAGLAFQLVTSGFNQLTKAEEHADKDDLELARATRRAAMNVLKSYLD